MEHDPVLRDIDNEYLETIAQTLRLGRRRAPLVPPAEDAAPTLLDLLRHPELRTREEAEPPVETTP